MICDRVVSNHPSHTDLLGWTQGHFDLSTSSAKYLVGFLHKAGVLESAADRIHLSEYANRWYAEKDDAILVGLLHSRIRFVGEMLAELRGQPRSIEELRQAAQQYNLNWKRPLQVALRRGWLQSAKLIEPPNEGRLALTDAGRDLLSKLTLQPRSSEPAPLQPPPAPRPPVSTPDNIPIHHPDVPKLDKPAPSSDSSPAQALADEIRAASTDSKNPDRLEIAVRDAFRFLGFDAEKLGGAGKTDVLVTAPLGRDDSYSATVDAKTVGNGALGDGQVDWTTLGDHRKQHDAKYSMLVGPNPSGGRLLDRATSFTVAVLSTEQLAYLCLRHASAPLGLETYRALFETGGAVNITSVEQAAQDVTRTRDLAVELCTKLAELTSKLGPIKASQLLMVITDHSEQEIQQTLDTLASPLIGAIQGTAERGYVLAAAPRVTQARLQQLGDALNP